MSLDRDRNARIPTSHAAVENSGRIVGKPECAGINRHVVGDEKSPYGKGEQRIHPGLESRRRYREVSLEA